MPKSDRDSQLQKKKWSILQSVDVKADKLDLDALDLEIISHMVNGINNANISRKLKKPLSTVQRRTRKLVEKGFVSLSAEANFKAFRFKKGMMLISTDGTDPFKLCDVLIEIDGIIHASAFLGNTDVMAISLYRESRQMVNLIAKVRAIEGVSGVTWSEEVYSVPE